MGNESRRLANGLRGVALAGIAALGIVALVGSGGGGLGFPPCGPPICSVGPPPPPPPTATVEPETITALVGTSATFAAAASNFSGSLSYQWSRWSDSSNGYVEIAGATGRTFTQAGVNLADDGAQFRVAVRSTSGESSGAVGRLTVSSVPGLVFQDGEFQPSDWLVSALAIPGTAVPVHTEERVTLGGNPGAYRRMVFQIPPGAGAARVFYTSLSATYEPQQQGAIKVIDYAEDCIALQNSDVTYTDSKMLIEQAGRRYLSEHSGQCIRTQWSAVASRASLRARDFYLFDGPACQAGESCPDFSANALPMRFGYWRIVWGIAGDTIGHGIDNWKVTVWR